MLCKENGSKKSKAVLLLFALDLRIFLLNMPEVEMPLNLNNSSDNSSISSIENIASSRTSSSDGQNVVIFEQDQISVMSHFIPTFPPRLSSYEPKLDELLVSFYF